MSNNIDKCINYKNEILVFYIWILEKRHEISRAHDVISTPIFRGVYGFVQLRKPNQTHPKKVGWVGYLGGYGFKKCKTHKKRAGFV